MSYRTVPPPSPCRHCLPSATMSWKPPVGSAPCCRCAGGPPFWEFRCTPTVSPQPCWVVIGVIDPSPLPAGWGVCSHISGCVAFDANGFLPGFRCRRNFLCSQSAPPPPSGAPLCLTLNPAGPPNQSVIPGWNFILLLPTLWQRMCVRGGSVSHMAQS